MKIIFFGTPGYVIPIVEVLHKNYNSKREQNFIAVVTQEPKQVGRDKKITRSAVDNWAYKHNIEVLYDFSSLPKADLGISAAYGKIIPQTIIKQFSKGIINIHPSILPHFRGASPIEAEIATNASSSGVTLIRMDELMDHGPIITQFKDQILPDDTFESVRNRSFKLAATVLVETIPAYLIGKIKLKEQDHSKATFTTLINKNHAFVKWKIIKDALEAKASSESTPYGFIKDTDYKADPDSLDRLIRAMTPWPMVWTEVKINDNSMRLKIHKAHVKSEKLVLDEVQLEGKNKVSWEQLQAGYAVEKF